MKKLMKNVKFVLMAVIGVFICENTGFSQATANGCVISGQDASALGYQTEATGFRTTALGYKSKASGHYSLASGYYTEASGSNSASFGFYTEASGSNSVSFGNKSVAGGKESLAAGHWSDASGSYSFALGARATASNSHAMAFGIDVIASGERSMIIGAGWANGSANKMHNNIPYSLMVGFKSTIPTLFVGPSSGVNTTGKVGIATTNTPSTIGAANISNYSLYVKGGILTEELRVRTGWADYVFNDDYELKPLYEVKQFIDENGHLPNVPSASQVEEEGIELGEITKIQQEKIEELTLYLIQQQKELDELKTLVRTLTESK